MIIPEFVILIMTCAVMLATVYRPEPEFTYRLAQYTLLGTLLLVIGLAPGQREVSFNGSVIVDNMAVVLKSFILLVTALVFLYSRDYLQARQLFKGEYFTVGLFAVLGMMVMASAGSFLTAYLGLELMSLSLYTLVSMQRDSKEASEAAMKYFVLGALASGMLLYGISIIYGVTGSIDFAQVSSAIQQHGADNRTLLVFGVVFVVVGVTFKLGAAPFHMWIPDVYHGAPTAITLFIGAAPKIAAFALAYRLLVDGLGNLVKEWQDMLMILAALSMAIGNTIAIAQSNMKRLLAYSTIAHMGFLLLGLLAGSKTGYAGSLFYVISYALMSTGGFGMIVLLSRAGFESDQIEDFKGLGERSPWLALMMLMLIFSMAGVPPFVGFWAKWFVIKEALAAGYVGLSVLAMAFSIIGAYYYLRIIKLMYFDKPEAGAEPVTQTPLLQWVMGANGFAMLVLGLVPGILMGVCVAAVQ